MSLLSWIVEGFTWKDFKWVYVAWATFEVMMVCVWGLHPEIVALQDMMIWASLPFVISIGLTWIVFAVWRIMKIGFEKVNYRLGD